MNKAALILVIVSGLIGACVQMIQAVDASEADSSVTLRREPLLMESLDGGAPHEALCREVEVPLDEGYGVSRIEKRSVCQDSQ
jgi:hypothetical protein